MDRTLSAIARSWPNDPWPWILCAVVGAVYLRGWHALHRRRSRWFDARTAASFVAGLACLLAATASPIEPLSNVSFLAHMGQHLLLLVAAPLLLLGGRPLVPLLRGLPRFVRRDWVAPWFQAPEIRAAVDGLLHPLTAWIVSTALVWLWHAPALYQLALASPRWHYFEHACFFVAGLVFWQPVVRPFPARARMHDVALLPYLFFAALQGAVLAALLTFADRPIYAHYAAGPGFGGLSATTDQALAGAVMWIVGSIAYLVPAVWIAFELLHGDARRGVVDPGFAAPGGSPGSSIHTSIHTRGDRQIATAPQMAPVSATSRGLPTRRPVALPILANAPAPRIAFDLLRVPIVGPMLRSRRARIALRATLAALAALVVIDGLWGPELAPLNLAGVWTWTHWRGLTVVALLVAGNLFCMACPFTLPRSIARRFLPRGRAWPEWLQGKWIALGLLAMFLWAYEALDLWASPWWTAWIVVAYFAAALAVDGFFRGAAFCKHVCPIGQFHFVASTVSPLEVRVRDAGVCGDCQSADCLRGRGELPGCELNLLLPRKLGNLDCTFCLDCVDACPHENVGLLVGAPAKGLIDDSRRSGVGRLADRTDLAALVVVFVFGAFANAAGMVAPVVAWQDAAVARYGVSLVLIETVGLVAALVVAPALLIGAAALATFAVDAGDSSWRRTATRFAWSLAPIGTAMWAAHFLFHFLTSWQTAWPAAQRFAGDLGVAWLGEPSWARSCCGPVGDWVVRVELALLDLGLLASLYVAYRLADRRAATIRRALVGFAPWGALVALLFFVGVWTVFQPMEMRGTLDPAQGAAR